MRWRRRRAGRCAAVDSWLQFTLAALAVYYVTLSVTKQDGPFEVFGRLRAHWSANDWKGRGIRCHVCVSLYSALGVTGLLLLLGWCEIAAVPVVWLGLAGASVLIDKYWSR